MTMALQWRDNWEQLSGDKQSDEMTNKSTQILVSLEETSLVKSEYVFLNIFEMFFQLGDQYLVTQQKSDGPTDVFTKHMKLLI